MKISVEIKDGKFHYTYEVGKSSATSEMELSAEGLILFTELLNRCNQHWRYDLNQRKEQMWAKCLADEIAPIRKENSNG